MKFVTETIMVILVTVATESWAANKTVSSSSGVTKTSGTTVSAKPSRSLFLPKTSTSVSYYPKKTVRISSSTSHFPQPTYAPKTTTTFNSTDTDDEESNATVVSITTTTSTTPPPKSQDKKMDRSGLADSEIYQAPVRRTSSDDELSVYVPGNISLQKLNADRKMSTYFGKSSYIQRPESTSTKLNTSPVTILVHASPDKVPKIKPKRKNLSMTPTKKRSDFKTTYSTMYPATSSTYNTRSYQTTPNYKSSPYRSRSIPAIPPTASPYKSSPSYETTMSPNYHSSESTTVPTTQAGLVNYMVRNLLMQANVMNQLLPLVQQIASQVPSVLADVEAAKNQLAFSQAKDELASTMNSAVNQYNSNNNNVGNGIKINRPPQSFSSPAQSSSSNHQDNRDTNYYTNIKHKPTTTRSYGQSKTNTELKTKPVNKFDPYFYPTRPMTHHTQDDFYQTEDNFGEEDQFRPYHSHEKAKVTQGPFSSLQVGNKEYTLPTFKISLNTDSDSGRPGGNKVALGERPYFTMGDNDQGRPSDNRVAESFAKNAYYEGNLPKSTQSVVNSVVPIVLQLHHSRKQKDRDQSSSVIKVVEVKETRSHNPNMPSPTIVEVVEEKEDRKPSNPVIQVIEVKDGKRKSSPHLLNTDTYGNHESFGQESILKVEEKNPHQHNLDEKYEELKKAVLKEAAFREATFKEAARIVKNLQHMDSSTLDKLPDAIRDHAFHHHGDGIEDNFEHSESSRPGKILGPFHKPVKDRFKDFFDESERFKDDLKMSSDDLGHAMMKHHNNHHHDFKDSTFSEISQRLRHSQKDSVPLPPNPESIGLEGAQLEVLKEAIAKAMEEEKRGGKPKDIHVMPRPLNHHDKHNSEDDLLKLFNNEHKVSHKPKVHLIPLKNNNEHHDFEFHSIEDASPQNAASLSEETKKVLEKYSAIDVIEPNHIMHRPHPFLFPGMHPPPFPFPRLPMPGPFPHVPMPHGPMPRPFPPRPFPMVPFPYGPRPPHLPPPHLPPHLPPHGPPRGPFPHPLLPPHRPPMGPFPRPFLPPLPHPPPFKKRSGDDEETPEEHATEEKDKVAKTEVKA